MSLYTDADMRKDVKKCVLRSKYTPDPRYGSDSKEVWIIEVTGTPDALGKFSSKVADIVNEFDEDSGQLVIE